MIIDSHCHVGKSVYGDVQTPFQLLKTMDEYGIDRAIICPFTPVGLNFKTENDRIARLVQRYPNRFIGFARVDPRVGNKAVREIERAVRILGLKGVKIHPMEQAFQVNDELIFPFMRKVADLNIPVLIASGYPLFSSPIQIGDLAKRFTSVPIIMTHGGLLNVSGLTESDSLKVIRENKNLIVETSGIEQSGPEGFIKKVADHVGAKRIVFGSNSPYMHVKLEMERVRAAGITDVEKNLILGSNVADIL